MKLRIPRSSLTMGLSLVALSAMLSACGGGSTTTSPVPKPTPSPTVHPTTAPTPTPTPTQSPIVTPTQSPTIKPTGTPTPTSSPTTKPTTTPSTTPTPTGPQIVFSPNPIVFVPPYNPSFQQSINFYVNGVLYNGFNFVTTTNGCTGDPANVIPFSSYGWIAEEGPHNGTCQTTFQTSANPSDPSVPFATGTLTVTNNSH